MLAKLFDLINRTDTLVVDDQVIDTVGFCDNFMPDQQVMLARLSIDDTDYHFADQEVDLDNGCAMAVALVWGMDGAEEVKVSMAFKVEVMLELEDQDSLIEDLRDLKHDTPPHSNVPVVQRIEALEKKHGSLRAAANACGIDPGYLCRLKNSEKMNPSDEVLSALGLERVIYYRDKQIGGEV